MDGAEMDESKEQILPPSTVPQREEEKTAEVESVKRWTDREDVRRGRRPARANRRQQRDHPREQDGWYEEYDGVWWYCEPARGWSTKGTVHYYYWDEEQDCWISWEEPKPSRRKRGGGKKASKSLVDAGRSQPKPAEVTHSNVETLLSASEVPPTTTRETESGATPVLSHDSTATDEHAMRGRDAASPKKRSRKKRVPDRQGKVQLPVASKNAGQEDDCEVTDEALAVDREMDDPGKGLSSHNPEVTGETPPSSQETARKTHKKKHRDWPSRSGRGKQQSSKVTVQCDELAQQLMAGSYECMVCCDRVTERAEVWACPCCFHIFHLRCIGRWARSPAAALSEGQSKVGWEGKEENDTVSCRYGEEGRRSMGYRIESVR